jgi:hypothetical protein
MKILFLFYTQSEAGAPGFLSRNGEESAGNLAQTLFGFASETLKLPLDDAFEARAQSLTEDIRWRAFKKPESLEQAVRAASQLYPDLLLFSGESTRSLKTAEPVAQVCALPVCVDARLDRCTEDKPRQGVLSEAIHDLISTHVESLVNKPRTIWVATSQKALLEWTSSLMDEPKWRDFSEVFGRSTMNDTIPTVFACGYEKTADGPRWVVD